MISRYYKVANREKRHNLELLRLDCAVDIVETHLLKQTIVSMHQLTYAWETNDKIAMKTASYQRNMKNSNSMRTDIMHHQKLFTKKIQI